MADELLDIYDEQNRPTGEQKMKSEAHAKGLWHRTSHIWMYTATGEIILQLRASSKDLFPDMWDISAAGHIGAGEDETEAAQREIEEELGWKVHREQLQISWVRVDQKVYGDIINNEFNNVYFLECSKGLEEFTLQEEELAAIQFMKLEALEQALEETPEQFVPHGEYWQEVIAEIRTRISN